jgi:hypothetical protein
MKTFKQILQLPKNLTFIYAYPILLTSIGVTIHAFGLLGIEYCNAPAWIHFIMLSVDSAVVVGLILKSSWGWWLAIALFIEQVILQTYSLHQLGWLETSLPLQIPVPLLCLTALIILILNKNKFIRLQDGQNEIGI